MILDVLLAGAAVLPLPAAGGGAVRQAALVAAIEAYTTFVIPRCAAGMVEDYLQGRAERDRMFVRSLGKLFPEYKAATTRARERDQQIVYHCFGPPPPPGAAPPDQVEVAQRDEANRLSYAAEADSLFNRMVVARQSLFHKRGD